ncbi:MAG: hypothetical protein JHC98_02980 [Thermoleophilaceae bacterium]|nr:hypothetical protein [Thermoleophilaceae bacterium]
MSDQGDHRSGDEERGLEMVGAGAEAFGAITGGTVGTVGGPVGIVLGGVAGVAAARMFKFLGGEISKRKLSPAEEIRIGGAAAVAAIEIGSRQDEGEKLRNDGFFDPANGSRSDSDEVLEGILLQAAQSYEEKKVPYLGHLYAGIAFDSSISPAYAHVMIRMFDRLTYRELAILQYFSDKSGATDRVALGVGIEEGDFTPSIVLLGEGNRLGEERLLGNRHADGTVYALVDTNAGGIKGELFGTITPTQIGEDFIRLTKLSEIPASDLDDVARGFKGEIQ